jgi:hypothetical protein
MSRACAYGLFVACYVVVPAAYAAVPLLSKSRRRSLRKPWAGAAQASFIYQL